MEAVVEQNNGHERQIISLSQDSFYRELDDAESAQAAKGTFNFDHPGEKSVVQINRFEWAISVYNVSRSMNFLLVINFYKAILI